MSYFGKLEDIKVKLEKVLEIVKIKLFICGEVLFIFDFVSLVDVLKEVEI